MQHQPDPDEAVVTRAQGGDDSALDNLLQRYRDPVFAFVFRLVGQAASAEDVAQETFVRAFQNIRSFRFRRGARFSTWLFQLARNAALDEVRRQRRQPRHDAEAAPAEAIDPGPNAAHQVMNRELGDAIARAVATLPEDQRTALVLTEYHGLPATEVARVLHSSVRGAEARLFRARQAVRTLLARQGWV